MKEQLSFINLENSDPENCGLDEYFEILFLYLRVYPELD